MCLLVFSYKQYTDYPFVFAANRDESYSRPTKAAHVWQTTPKILAGKDQKAGGTWLGISENGRFAALTNYRQMDDIKEDTTSRGIIVKDFLLYKGKPREYLAELQRVGDKFNGFNLIAGTFDNLFYMSNRKEGIFKVQPGNHALSNAFLNTSWPKTEESSRALEKILREGEPDEDKLFKLLMNDQRYPIETLPDTGLPKDKEKAVSSVFIETDKYGTRSSTIVIVDKNNRVQFAEKTYIPGSKKTNKIVRKSFEL
ncbi:MAG: NRDE family protein [Balneolaceae bacterium]|nr:NRDE family protein [Balneolaceae bacterium]